MRFRYTKQVRSGNVRHGRLAIIAGRNRTDVSGIKAMLQALEAEIRADNAVALAENDRS